MAEESPQVDSDPLALGAAGSNQEETKQDPASGAPASNAEGSDEEDLFGGESDNEEKASKSVESIPVTKPDVLSSIPIPRTAPKAPLPPVAAPASDIASKFGFPAGVTVPKSVNAKLLQGRLLDTLRALPVNLINDALTEYDEAVHNKGDSIRNQGAYLYGVVKRYVNVQERTKAGEDVGMGSSLTPSVNSRLQQLISSGFCTEMEMNDKVRMKLRMLSEKDALLAIDELASVERHQIRNFGSYFMGILNRYMRGETGPTNFAKNKQPTDRKRKQDFNDQFSNRRARNHDNRFGQSGPPPAMHAQQQPYVPHTSYGQQPQQAYSQPPPPPPRPGATSFAQYPQGVQMPAASSQQFVPQQGGMPPSSHYGPSSQPQYGNSVVSYPGGPGGSNFPPPPPPHGRTHPMGMGVNNANMQMQQQMPPQSYVSSSQNNRFSQPQVPGYQMQQQQQPVSNYQQAPQIPLDILGLADKAASAVQALQNQRVGGASSMHQQPTGSIYAPSSMMPSHGAPTQSYSQHPLSMATQPGSNNQQKKRFTTATIQELPIAVQYAVQNLQITGQINGALDEGMLGMIKDLPEGLAVQSLQKFGSLDKSSMRNKTAYLAGLLRRELERINKR